MYHENPISTTSSTACWNLSATILWGVLIFVMFVLTQSAVAALVVYTQNQIASESEFTELFMASQYNGTVLSLATFVSAIMGCALVVLVIKLKRGVNLAGYLHLRRVPAMTYLKWGAAMLAYLAVVESLNFVLGGEPVHMFMAASYATADPVWLLWLALIIIAPVFEEVFFRGFLFTGIVSSVLGSAGAILLTAVAWAIIHLQYGVFEIGMIFILGIMLGMARYYSGSLLVPLFLHSLNNLLATVQTALFA
jgi:membrane protease YdiL (CAAX protease family)